MKGSALWIAWKSLRQHALSTWIASGSIALAGGLLMAVWALRSQAESTFAEANGGFDAVLGPRGSQLQLVLNSIFHLEASSGTIPAPRAPGQLLRPDHGYTEPSKKLPCPQASQHHFQDGALARSRVVSGA